MTINYRGKTYIHLPYIWLSFLIGVVVGLSLIAVILAAA